jgi:hypothetical protein
MRNESTPFHKFHIFCFFIRRFRVLYVVTTTPTTDTLVGFIGSITDTSRCRAPLPCLYDFTHMTITKHNNSLQPANSDGSRLRPSSELHVVDADDDSILQAVNLPASSTPGNNNDSAMPTLRQSNEPATTNTTNNNNNSNNSHHANDDDDDPDDNDLDGFLRRVLDTTVDGPCQGMPDSASFCNLHMSIDEQLDLLSGVSVTFDGWNVRNRVKKILQKDE